MLGNGDTLFTNELGITAAEGIFEGIEDKTLGCVGATVGFDWLIGTFDLLEDPSWETNLTTALTASDN